MPPPLNLLRRVVLACHLGAHRIARGAQRLRVGSGGRQQPFAQYAELDGKGGAPGGAAEAEALEQSSKVEAFIAKAIAVQVPEHT